MRVEQNLTAESPVRPRKFPLGMILVLVWVGSTILIGLPMVDPLLFFVMKPLALEVFSRIVFLFDPWLYLEGGSLLWRYTAFLAPVLLGASFYGILTRKGWARALTIGWSAYSFALLLHDIISREELAEVLFRQWLFGADNVGSFRGVTFLVLDLIGLGVNAAVAVYLYRKRGFFHFKTN